MNESLVKYIQTARLAGLTQTQIHQSLVNAGWDAGEVSRHFSLPVPPPPPPSGSKSTATSATSVIAPKSGTTHTMWDAFEHVLLFFSLYVLTGAIAFVFHGMVNRYVPDPGSMGMSEYGDMYDHYSSSIRWALAAVIVSWPLFAFFFIDITRRTVKVPTLRLLTARRILVYLTLIVAFVILVWQLIRVVFTLLDGNFALGFALHFLVSAGISGIVFAYYGLQVKSDRNYES